LTEPKFPTLKKKFERVPAWWSVCPYLLDDDDGTITEEINGNHQTIAEKRDEMLTRFLQMSDPTWKKVVDALRLGNFSNLADEIEHDQINNTTS